jgi:hypothetical protein
MPSCRPPNEQRRRPCETTTRIPAFEVSSKRRKGYPSETRVKRGLRIVHGDKELLEKLSRNDPCPLRFREAFSRSAVCTPASTTAHPETTTFR